MGPRESQRSSRGAEVGYDHQQESSIENSNQFGRQLRIVCGLPLSRELNPRIIGAAFSTHLAGHGYRLAVPPKQLRSMSVSMTPGSSGTAAIGRGSSSAKARVSPSIAHLLAQ